MPYPAQISHEMVLETACRLLESEGAENLSLSKLAAEMGVKAPSLYRYFGGKNELLKAINTRTMEQLVGVMQSAIREQSSQEQVLEMARAYREFARQSPSAYMLALGNLSEEMRPDPSHLEALALPLQAVMAKIGGEESALPMLRGAWALIHGFVMLEINQSFRRGGSLDDAFEQAVTAYVRGWLFG